MREVVWSAARVLVAVVVLLPGAAYAQSGNIAGVVRDTQGETVPGVTVEVTSPALIEKVRSTVTDGNGRYQIIALPVGTYTVTFTLTGFSKIVRSNVATSNDFTNTVNADLKPGDVKEVIEVKAATPLVDTMNARQQMVFTGDEIKDLPTSRNLSDLYQLVPGISISGFGGSIAPICSGGVADATNLFAVEAASGPRSGCGPLMTDFNAHTGGNDLYGLNQGRVQLDGMGIQSFAGGGRSSYVADIANSQEISFTLSGSLGESETGGATINIIPRTGGNRYAGNFFTSYGDHKYFDKNNGTRPSSFNNRLDYQYDVNGSYGGPILRDRLWFQSSARRQERASILTSSFRNMNEGVFGANYVGDNSRPLDQGDMYQNVNLRLTLQATQKNKFNVFWDEQYTCENPCEGVVDGFTSIEASPSVVSYPLHVAQLSWNNPLTNQILMDAGLSLYGSHRDTTKNRYEPNYPHLPQIAESGVTIATPTLATTQVTTMTSGSINNEDYWNTDNIQSRASVSYVTGSHNAKFGYQGGYLSRQTRPYFNNDRIQYGYASPAANCTPGVPSNNLTSGNNGPHLPLPQMGTISGINPNGGSAWCGLNPDGTRVYDGRQPGDSVLGIDSNGNTFEIPLTALNTLTDTDPGAAVVTNPQIAQRNAWLLANGYISQTGTAAAQSTRLRPPVPAQARQYVPFNTDEDVWFAAFYLQDQWTMNRLTVNGAVRYDLSRSKFNETCVGPDRWVSEATAYCYNDGISASGKGVDFQDITPRWGLAYDLFGNGKTSLKWNMGKYVGGAQVGGIFTAMNPAQAGRSTNNYGRTWRDIDGDRIPDCDLNVLDTPPPATGTVLPDGVISNGGLPDGRPSGECGGEEAGAQANARRFGRSPYEFSGGDVIGVGTVYCGQPEALINQKAVNYCNNYLAAGGKSLVSGWNSRAYQWQMGLGVQHELLPRLSMEVTYNTNWAGNRVLTDAINVADPNTTQIFAPAGCDLYSVNPGGTVDPDTCMSNLLNHTSSFYDFYGIQAPLDRDLPNGGGYIVSGIPVVKPNLQAANTVTVQVLDFENRVIEKYHAVDTNFTLRAAGGLRITGGTSTGYRYRDTCNALVDNPPGTTLREGRELSCHQQRPTTTNVRGTATYTVPWVDVLVSTTFQYRPGQQLTATYTVPATQVIWEDPSAPGTITGGNAPAVNLLSDDSTGEGIRLFDLRLAKNIRFGSKRVNIGADVYNLFNSDGAISYCSTFPQCGTGATAQPWGRVNTITTPRYARFQMQFDF